MAELGRVKAVILHRNLKGAEMNIYGIATAVGILPAYKRAKAKAEEAYTALLNYKAWLRSLNEKPEKEQSVYVDWNSELDGVTCTVILRVGNIVGKMLSADGYLILTNHTSDRELLINKIGVSFRIFGQPITTYIPRGTVSSIELRAGQQVQIPLSGNTGLIFFANADTRDEFRNDIVEAYNAATGKHWTLITSIPKNTDVDGIATANVEFQYTGITNVGQPNRARYVQQPCTVRYMGEAFSPNERNIFDPKAGNF